MQTIAQTELKPIKLYLLTGFLGSGKTTLLKRLFTQLTEYKLGVLINEFENVGVDGAAR